MKITTKMFYLGASSTKNLKEPDKPYFRVSLAGSDDGTLDAFVQEEQYTELKKLKRFQEISVDLDYVRTAKGDRLYFSDFRRVS